MYVKIENFSFSLILSWQLWIELIQLVPEVYNHLLPNSFCISSRRERCEAEREREREREMGIKIPYSKSDLRRFPTIFSIYDVYVCMYVFVRHKNYMQTCALTSKLGCSHENEK